ncbi:alpha-2 adrenergic receptor [Trichonephila clavipes]|nr:alpha-2 adrenergic receptor [Trichonephila clavipes]
MKIGNNGNLVLCPFDESTPCLMIVLMNCQTKLRINHLTAIKSVTILESSANLNFYTRKKNTLYMHMRRLLLAENDEESVAAFAEKLDMKDACYMLAEAWDSLERDYRLCPIDSRILNDDEIAISVQEESNPVDDEMDEDQDNNNNESSKGPSNADTLSALDTAKALETVRTTMRGLYYLFNYCCSRESDILQRKNEGVHWFSEK